MIAEQEYDSGYRDGLESLTFVKGESLDWQRGWHNGIIAAEDRRWAYVAASQIR